MSLPNGLEIDLGKEGDFNQMVLFTQCIDCSLDFDLFFNLPSL
jgi:hypothetical protein